ILQLQQGTHCNAEKLPLALLTDPARPARCAILDQVPLLQPGAGGSPWPRVLDRVIVSLGAIQADKEAWRKILADLKAGIISGIPGLTVIPIEFCRRLSKASKINVPDSTCEVPSCLLKPKNTPKPAAHTLEADARRFLHATTSSGPA